MWLIALISLAAVGLMAQPAPLDIHRAQTPGAPHPAIVLLHGGNFTDGSRADAATRRLARLFSNAGLTVFAAGYSLAPASPFPAAVEDTLAVANWVRTHAREHSVDPRRIALIGHGAGGYLANMAAARGAPVQAVISIGGWSDFRNQPITPSLAAFLGSTPAEAASPAMHLAGNEPPFLLIHGDHDETVPLSQSLHLQSALQAVRVPCSLLIIEGGGHDPLAWETLPTARPWEREMLMWLQKAFVRK